MLSLGRPWDDRAALSKSQPQHPAGLAKVVAVDGEGDGLREQGGAVEKRPEQQTPVMETFATKNAETEIGMREGHKISPITRAGDPRRLVLAQERADPLVIWPRRIKVSHEAFVALAQ